MRAEVTQEFSKFLDRIDERITRVAVLGGTSQDPEVEVLKVRYPSAEFHFLDIDNPFQDLNFHFIDINESSSLLNYESYFDLVISSQVIEHIWNHTNYFKLLCNLVHTSGLIWVNCPKSNMVHGSPHYFSAGFTDTYLSKNLESQNCKILGTGEIGNRRYYLGVHLGRYWQTPRENRHPLMSYNFQTGSWYGIMWKYMRDFPTRVFLSGVSDSGSSSNEYATEAYVLAQRNSI